MLLKLDEKGRVLIPAHIRRRLGLKRVVKMYIEKDRLIIESVEDPAESLAKTVVKASNDIEEEITSLRRRAEKEGLKRIEERWL